MRDDVRDLRCPRDAERPCLQHVRSAVSCWPRPNSHRPFMPTAPACAGCRATSAAKASRALRRSARARRATIPVPAALVPVGAQGDPLAVERDRFVEAPGRARPPRTPRRSQRTRAASTPGPAPGPAPRGLGRRRPGRAPRPSASARPVITAGGRRSPARATIPATAGPRHRLAALDRLAGGLVRHLQHQLVVLAGQQASQADAGEAARCRASARDRPRVELLDHRAAGPYQLVRTDDTRVVPAASLPAPSTLNW